MKWWIEFRGVFAISSNEVADLSGIVPPISIAVLEVDLNDLEIDRLQRAAREGKTTFSNAEKLEEMSRYGMVSEESVLNPELADYLENVSGPRELYEKALKDTREQDLLEWAAHRTSENSVDGIKTYLNQNISRVYLLSSFGQIQDSAIAKDFPGNSFIRLNQPPVKEYNLVEQKGYHNTPKGRIKEGYTHEYLQTLLEEH